jgi:hypothetical protein
MEIGARIYYELATGNVILNTGERAGDVVETTREQDFESYKALIERVPESVGMLELEYGQFAEDFAASNGYRVNLDSEELEFSYVDPDDPGEPAFQPPLSARVLTVETESAGMALELALTQARLDQAEQEQAALILNLVEGGVL